VPQADFSRSDRYASTSTNQVLAEGSPFSRSLRNILKGGFKLENPPNGVLSQPVANYFILFCFCSVICIDTVRNKDFVQEE
jgi:hypothetical protein